MTEGIKHTGCGLHLDHGAATVDTDVEGSQEWQEIASKGNLYGARVYICGIEGHMVRTKPLLYEYQEHRGTLWRPT